MKKKEVEKNDCEKAEKMNSYLEVLNMSHSFIVDQFKSEENSKKKEDQKQKKEAPRFKISKRDKP